MCIHLIHFQKIHMGKGSLGLTNGYNYTIEISNAPHCRKLKKEDDFIHLPYTSNTIFNQNN
nr:MAG TPA: hypothetical protein [Caudoviricetes sp.]